jgi:hypothetical protein
VILKIWRNFPTKTEILVKFTLEQQKKFQNCPFFFWSKNDNIWPQKQKKTLLKTQRTGFDPEPIAGLKKSNEKFWI